MTKQISKPKNSQKGESKTYQAMLSELDDIVRAVSQGDLDLDDVVGKVEHGYELIGTMRQRLDQTRAKVEALRVDFEKNSARENTSPQKTSRPKDSPQKTDDQSASDTSDDDDLPF